MAARVDDNYNKLDLANEAAARSAALLGKDDRLAVWHVDTTIYETIKMGPVLDPVATGKKIKAVGVGGGGIFIDLSLREGYKALEKETHGIKHMLLFSDGADAEERTDAPSLVKAAAKKGITTSVIALGDGYDVPALADMAKLGGGRFYLITDARKLPAVFAQETVLAAKSSVHEEEFVPRVRSASPTLKGIDWKKAPCLRGYVVTQPKPRSQVVLDGIEGDPVLAPWPIGLGHSGRLGQRLHRPVGRGLRAVAGRGADDGAARARDRSQGRRGARAARRRGEGRCAARHRGALGAHRRRGAHAPEGARRGPRRPRA